MRTTWSRPISALLVCVCTLIGVARADSPWLYGAHWYGTDGDVEDMTAGKCVWVLETVMTYDGNWDADARRGRMETAVARGHTIITRIQPRWGWAVPREEEMAAYLNAVADTAHTLRNVCHIWQIGNEMNNPGEYGGGYLDPFDYVDRFKRIRTAIKSIDSPLGEQMVLLGPTSSFAVSYLQMMLMNLDPPDLDGIAIHGYGVNPDPFVMNSLLNFRASYQEQLALIDQYGFRYKPVFITEFDRCTDPVNDATQEATSSQFLYLAYQQLDAWNHTPGTHPIIAAIWFIYPDDSNWGCYSLRRHKAGPRGADVNLWDAFQHAATQGYPAGTTTTALAVSADAFTKETPYHTNATSDAFTITNIGWGAMDYGVTVDADWLETTPAVGVSHGEPDEIAILYDTVDLPSAEYTTTVRVSATDAIDSPQEIAIRIDVLPPPGDQDRDGDVDQEDFGIFQACYSGSGRIQRDPACRFARLDHDVDVDLNDFGIFQGCLSGPNIPADPDCADW